MGYSSISVLTIRAVCGNQGSTYNFDQPWWVQDQTKKNLLDHNVKISLLILKGGEIVRSTGLLVYIQIIPVGVTLGLKAMSHVGRIPRTPNWRYTICAENYVVNNEKHPILAPELIQVEMAVIDQGLEHPLVNPFLYLHIWIGRSDILGRRIKA